MKRVFILLACLIGFAASSIGQTKNDAIGAFNRGIDLTATDPVAAIKAFEECIQISIQLGEEGEETKELAEINIPPLYYEVALKLYRDRKIEEAISGFETAVQISEKYKDADIKSRSENVLHQLYFTWGNSLSRSNDDEKALEFFNKALSLNPSYARAYLGKALVYRKQEKTPDFAQAMDMAIETGLTSNDERTIATAESTARDYFLVRAIRAKDRKAYSEALNLIEASLKYDKNFADTYYLITVIANAQSRWNDAIETGIQTLELMKDAEKGETAKVYFELGNAYAGKGDSISACKAYRDASFGNYAESAIYQIQHVLKCQ